MTGLMTSSLGGFGFIPAVFQYSGGVVASPGFRLERVRFSAPVPMAAGFERIAAHLDAIGRPKAAFCACELRSPAPFSEGGFEQFNRLYAGTLESWGVLVEGHNPVARSNVCPELDGPPEPSFHAFTYTVPDGSALPSFVVAGCGEAEEGKATYAESIVARGDVSPAGLRRKAQSVLGEQERRLAALGAGWAETTAVQVYTVHDLHPFLADEIVRRGAGRHGLTWQFCRPPVVDLEYEMDCRAIHLERVMPA